METEYGETNRGKIRAYFAANLSQKPNHVIVTNDEAGAVMTLEPVLDHDGTPLLLPNRLRVCREDEHARILDLEKLEGMNMVPQITVEVGPSEAEVLSLCDEFLGQRLGASYWTKLGYEDPSFPVGGAFVLEIGALL